ncbi:MAG TPA: ZIP family metal transporter [Solirubrobacterales bacterium]|nr:ZIP family metal transporter [Solirubrobacterales bacterium]
MLVLILAGTGTALATGLGAIPVFLIGPRAAESMRPFLLGFAAGVMTAASIVGLVLPALDEGSGAEVAAGLVAGLGFLIATRRYLRSRDPHIGRLRGAGVSTSILVFAVLLAHSLPEGLAIGAAYASDTQGLALFVIVAIALQNIPEGTSVAVPMQGAGFSHGQQFWAAVGTSAPQPVGAVIAYLAVEEVSSLLPVSFAFAAGAMLTLVVAEVVPEALSTGGWRSVAAGCTIGAAVMVALSLVLGVG